MNDGLIQYLTHTIDNVIDNTAVYDNTQVQNDTSHSAYNNEYRISVVFAFFDKHKQDCSAVNKQHKHK